MIPEGITQIDASAFSGCEDIEHIVFPNSLTKIGRSAFYNCLSLKSICFSEGLLFIDHAAFCGCKKLSSISLPNSLTFIGDNAFSRTGISSVTIPAKVECIYCNPFQDCKYLSTMHVSRENEHYFSDGNCIITRDTNVLVSGCVDSLIPRDVLEIGRYAFAFCHNLLSLDLPEKLQCIRANAFEGCDSLSSIEVPNGVKTIGDHAFSSCKNLINIVLPNSLSEIRQGAFSGCLSLAEIEIPNSVEILGDYAFLNSGLVRINIHDKLTRIGRSCFKSCSRLQYVRLPWLRMNYYLDITGDGDQPREYLERDDDANLDDSIPATLLCFNDVSNCSYFSEESKSLFYKCNTLSRIEISGHWRILPPGVWRGVVQASIADGVERIEERTFEYHDTLTEIFIPSSVTSIGCNAFLGCIRLKSVILPPNLLEIGEFAFSKSGIEEIAIPGKITVLESFVFSHCESLRTIRVPSSVQRIEDYAFSECDALTTIELYQDNPDNLSISSRFLTESAQITIMVPVGAGYTYRHHPIFSQFTILPVL